MDNKPDTPNILCDLLTALDVPYIRGYTLKRFSDMPFKTMFGLTKLLQEYGVECEGYKLTDNNELLKIQPPFLAHTKGGFVIVERLDSGSVEYMTQGVIEQVSLQKFLTAFDGTLILAYPSADAREPDYALHARLDFFQRAKKWVLLCCSLMLIAYLFISNGLACHVSCYFILAFDLAGLYFTYLLVQKSLHRNSHAADRVCGVLQAGGCDDILQMKASKFFGLFGWSEVGFAYFSVSLMTMLLFPYMLPWLALCNVCCLPFTVWSIWYQRFRAHKWCTLCVSVQSLLWCLFASYLAGGWLHQAWPPSISFFALGVSYLTVMLGINAVMPLMEANDRS